MNRYFINGWEETREYFLRVGEFTRAECKKLAEGKIIIKDENTFFVEINGI